jgi:hypothetical protein
MWNIKSYYQYDRIVRIADKVKSESEMINGLKAILTLKNNIVHYSVTLEKH